MKKKVAVFFGGRSVEHEVSIITGLQVAENLDKDKYEVYIIYVDKEGNWYGSIFNKKITIDTFKNLNYKKLSEVTFNSIYKDKKLYICKKGKITSKVFSEVDVVIPAIHGTNGEDGSFQGLLEFKGIPYTCSGIIGSSIGMDKVIMKKIFIAEGIPVVDFLWYYRSYILKNYDKVLNEIISKLGFPIFVKPANLGSSIGISKANNKESLKNAIEIAINYDSKIIFEKAIENKREVNISVIGFQNEIEVSLIEEPISWNEFLSFEDKYVNKNGKFQGMKNQDKRIIPADLSKEIEEKVKNYAIKAFKAIEARGIARIDFMLENNENLYITEINTIPGSFSFYLWDKKNIDFPELLNKLINIAFEYHNEKIKNKYVFEFDLLSNFLKNTTK